MALITPPSKRQQEIRAAEREEDLREAIVDSFLAGYNKEGRMGDTELDAYDKGWAYRDSGVPRSELSGLIDNFLIEHGFAPRE